MAKLTTIKIDTVTHERLRRHVGAIVACGGRSSIVAYATQAIELRLDRDKAPKLNGDKPANP